MNYFLNCIFEGGENNLCSVNTECLKKIEVY